MSNLGDLFSKIITKVNGHSTELSQFSEEVANSGIRALLQSDPLPNTTQQYTFAADGTISRINHMRDGAPVRTDAFTFAENAVVEVRTLATGESLTITTNLITLETTAQYAA